MRHTLINSPIGPLTIVANEAEQLTALYMGEDHRHRPSIETLGEYIEPEQADGVLVLARQELTEYFAGERHSFSVPFSCAGTEFQQRVWAALTEIPYGETRTYGELAAMIGNPAAVRAVGLANGKNPLSIVVPCHRVIGANKALTGYGGGIERKRILLELEGAIESEATLFV
ncbi:methylated-DNA--[protein]-cysteine S-methyltransferase [Humidisolicoccus flavus]|uniref:methylated-DNA--[protein]-cysteine S-methyltransferase n=1 Tax=Humidisolicoccus flavus TaxID=3111414 RepID=UPI00324D3A55